MHVLQPPPLAGYVAIPVMDDTGSERPLIFRDKVEEILGGLNHWDGHFLRGLDEEVMTANGPVNRETLWLQMEWRTPQGRNATREAFWECFYVDMSRNSYDPGTHCLSGMSLRARLFTATSPTNRGRLCIATTPGGASRLQSIRDHPAGFNADD